MKIVQANATELFDWDPMKHIERIGRICYKSEDRIGEGTAAKFIQNLYKRKHLAMLEHYRFIVEVDSDIYDELMMPIDDADGYCVDVSATTSVYKPSQQRYILGTRDNDTCVISTSARGLIECDDTGYYECISYIINHIVHTFKCYELFGNKYTGAVNKTISIIDDINTLTPYERMIHGWHSVLFITDRGVSHELVRHRDASFAQESTRYCNYGNNDEIAVLEPSFWAKDSVAYCSWHMACQYAECIYIDIVNKQKLPPQEARTVLPQSTKVEIVMTAPNYEWLHVKNLRLLGMTGTPHPQMWQVMNILNEKYEWMAELL